MHFEGYHEEESSLISVFLSILWHTIQSVIKMMYHLLIFKEGVDGFHAVKCSSLLKCNGLIPYFQPYQCWRQNPPCIRTLVVENTWLCT